MKRGSFITVALVIMTVAAIALGIPLYQRYRQAVMTSAELGLKSPVPPDDSCFQIQSKFAELLPGEAVRASEPLSMDEIAIYEAVLERWNSQSKQSLNVSNKTMPLDSDISDCECLKAIDVQSFANATRSYHHLQKNTLSSENLRIVDAEFQTAIVHDNDPHASMGKGLSVDAAVRRAFANGLFTLSEVAFDKEHHRAIVSFSFVCGSLCGSGSVWLFEKVDGTWKKAEHNCGGWIS